MHPCLIQLNDLNGIYLILSLSFVLLLPSAGGEVLQQPNTHHHPHSFHAFRNAQVLSNLCKPLLPDAQETAWTSMLQRYTGGVLCDCRWNPRDGTDLLLPHFRSFSHQTPPLPSFSSFVTFMHNRLSALAYVGIWLLSRHPGILCVRVCVCICYILITKICTLLAKWRQDGRTFWLVLTTKKACLRVKAWF